MSDCYNQCIDMGGGEYEIYDSTFDAGGRAFCMHMSGYATMSGSGNVLSGASMAAIYLGQAYASLTESHILSDTDYIKCDYFNTPPIVELDFRNNYWGTSDAEVISTRIEDGYDDPSEYVHVLFEPFSPVPLPDEKKSLGDVKRMFR